jgi:hypothetical protein
MHSCWRKLLPSVEARSLFGTKLQSPALLATSSLVMCSTPTHQHGFVPQNAIADGVVLSLTFSIIQNTDYSSVDPGLGHTGILVK